MGPIGVLRLHFPHLAGSKTPSRRKKGTHDCSLRPKAAGAIRLSVVLLPYLYPVKILCDYFLSLASQGQLICKNLLHSL